MVYRDWENMIDGMCTCFDDVYPRALEHRRDGRALQTRPERLVVAIAIIMTAVLLFLALLHNAVGVGVGDLGPVVLLLSQGRSGSTWLRTDVIPNLKPGSPILGEEILGKGNNALTLPNPLEIAQSYLRSQRKLYPNKTIGFKWKPVPADSTHHDPLLRWARLNKFSVVHSTRNPLDLALSVLKHLSDFTLISHCTTAECVNRHKSFTVHINITRLINHVKALTTDSASWKMKLAKFGVRSMELYYDDLVYAQDNKRLSTLQSLIDFIYPKEGIVAQLSHLENSQIEITTEYDHSKVMENYNEVARALEGTEYAKYLHTGEAPRTPNSSRIQ